MPHASSPVSVAAWVAAYLPWADLHDLDEAGRLAAGGLEHLAGLLLGHGPRRVPGLSLRQVDELGDVPADEVVLLRSADRPDKRALDLHQRCLAEHLGDVPQEPVGVGGLELRQLLGADLRIDPLLGLAAIGGHGVRIELERVEPVHDALLDGVGGRCPDAGLDLVVQVVELVLDLLLGLAADKPPQAFTGVVVAQRDGADVALVDLVPGDAIVTAFAATLRLGCLCSHRRYSSRLARFPVSHSRSRRP